LVRTSPDGCPLFPSPFPKGLPMLSIDYAAVKDRITIRDVLNLIRYRCLRISGNNAYGPCPLACSTNRRACHIELQLNLWHCFACRRGGNQLDLYRDWSGLELFHATVHLCEFLGVEVPRGRFDPRAN